MLFDDYSDLRQELDQVIYDHLLLQQLDDIAGSLNQVYPGHCFTLVTVANIEQLYEYLM